MSRRSRPGEKRPASSERPKEPVRRFRRPIPDIREVSGLPPIERGTKLALAATDRDYRRANWDVSCPALVGDISNMGGVPNGTIYGLPGTTLRGVSFAIAPNSIVDATGVGFRCGK